MKKTFTKGLFILALLPLIIIACKEVDESQMAEQYADERNTYIRTESESPTNPAIVINSGYATTDSRIVSVSLSATDNVGITGYYLSESSTTPQADDANWNSVAANTSYSASVSFTLSDSTGDKTVYAWFKDAAGNVSASVSDTIELVAAQHVYSGMVLISGGSFQMGDLDGGGYSDERPVHTVTLSSFYISDHEVTASEYKECVDDGGCSYNGGTSTYYTYGASGKENHPLNYVSWTETQDYISWLNSKSSRVYRLCTEAEWEYAARAGTTTIYSCGDNSSCLDNVAWWSNNNSPAGTKEVKTKQANAWGLYDMHGNVWEWVQDWYHSSYSGAPTDGSAWESPTGSSRVVRGGGFNSAAYALRSAIRGYGSPGGRNHYRGFRLCSVP